MQNESCVLIGQPDGKKVQGTLSMGDVQWNSV